jgi:hypothetical protein
MKLLAAATLGLLVLGSAAGVAGEELQRVPVVLHVHSDLSTGDLSLDELARMARAQELGGLFLVENYLLRAEYGLAPFRALTRVTHEERGVLTSGLEDYLARVARARRAHPELLIVPGVEVIPHQYWSGSPVGLAMTLHNTQKNLLVFGLSDPAALRSLPVAGNPHARRYGWQSLIDAVPALLLVPGVVLLLTKRVHRQRVGRAIVLVRRRHWVLGGVLAIVGIVALVRGWPFTIDAYPPWRDFGVAPHQELIDHVERLGGATIWSFPEAWDEGRRSIGGVKVSWRTEPYPDDLLRTSRYTAFAALYEQTTRFTQPGGAWDRLLVEYAAGERSRPAWGVGESGFHGTAAGKRLGAIQTVFLVRDRSEPAVLDALKRGRMYALQRVPEASLVLADWSVAAGNALAVSGETLRVAEGTPVDIRIAVDALGAGAEGLRVTLVRNGAVLNAWAGDTSVRATHREIFDGRPLVFRIDARARVPHRLVTNPIFVTRP